MRNLLPVLVLLVLAACSSSEAAPTFETTDSAGVRIVTSHAAAWGPEEAGWRVDDTPWLSIGELEGPEPYRLHGAADARRLPDGGVVYFDSGTGQIRTYDADGSHRRSMGGEGDGPGEFRMAWDLWTWPGDSLVVYDTGARRITVFGADGGLGRTLRIEGDDGPEQLIGVGSGGRLLTHSVRRLQDGLQQVTLIVRDADGAALDTIGDFPWLRTHRIPAGEGTWLLGSSTFAVPSSFEAAGDRVYVAVPEHPEILVYGMDGSLLQRIRWQERDRTVRPEDVDAHVAERLDASDDPDQRRRTRRILEQSPVADRFPTVSDLLVDAEGNVWAEEYRRPGEDGGRWRVFTAEGELLGTVRMPPGFTPTEIGEDEVIGIARDELDVQRVRVHALERG